MKIKYKFTTKFDLNPNYHEVVDDKELSGLINYLMSFEHELINPYGDKKVNIELTSKKFKGKVKVDELHIENKLIWHYRNGFTHDWELFKLAQQIKN